MTNFYNPTKLLKSNDRNGEKPEILISISNRGAGKTYGFAEFLMREFIDNGVKFGLLCRWQRELGSTAVGIFKAVLRDQYPDVEMYEVVQQKGVYSDIWINRKGENDEIINEQCGCVLPINGSDNIKKISSLFVDIDVLFFDEFQADSYCPKETEKFVNLHFTIARGNSDGVRFVPVIMASNSLSILNPYFEALGLTNKIQSNTKMYKGEGLVLERFVNVDVAEKQRQSAFNRAFSNSKQAQSNIDNSWLNDSWVCVAKPDGSWGRGTYLATLIDGDNKYGILRYSELFYIGRSVDDTCKNIFAMSENGAENIETAKRCLPLMVFRDQFLKGNGRFSDISVKDRILKWI